MPSTCKTRSSDIISPRKGAASVAVGRGALRSRSSLFSPSKSVYKSVICESVPDDANPAQLQKSKLSRRDSAFPESSCFDKISDTLLRDSFSDDQFFLHLPSNLLAGSPATTTNHERAQSSRTSKKHLATPEKLLISHKPPTTSPQCLKSVAALNISGRPIIKASGELDHKELTTSKDKVKTPKLNQIPAATSTDLARFVASCSGPVTELSQWGLPEDVVAAYRRVGIVNMFPWQAACLKTGSVLNGGNLVYSAPTSAGKSLVAEVLLLKRVIESKKKGLFILPFVALAREKMATLQKMFKGTGVRVGGFMGHLHPPGGLRMVDVAVCTIEKANSLINRLVEKGTLDHLGVIVVDELHMVGDDHRGYLIELLLTKVRFFNLLQANKLFMSSQTSFNEKEQCQIQIIGMSATLLNLPVVAKWLNAHFYSTDYRPVPLHEMIKYGPAIYNKQWLKQRDLMILPNIENDPDHLVSLCFETVQAGHSVLVFCPYKNQCESLAENIAKTFSRMDEKTRQEFVKREKLLEVIDQLEQSPAGLDKMLAKTVPFVTAFHHAGLTMDEREIIEMAFRKCYVKVLIATTTLSSGVNLPARRVIIRSPLFFGNKVIDLLTYYQMAGRAGRKGVDTEGESILVCKEVEKSKVTTLFASTLKPISSCLTPDSTGKINPKFSRAVLEIIANGAAKSIEQVESYINCTLFCTEIEALRTSVLARNVLKDLLNRRLIMMQSNFALVASSQLGNAVIWSGLSPTEGEQVFGELARARQCFNLEDDLHILYLITPSYLIDHVSSLDWYHFLNLWTRLPSHWQRVGNLVGVTDQKLATAVRGNVGNSEETDCLRRFYCALMLNELVNEVPISEVSVKYECNKGILQSLQQASSTYSGMVAVFCKELGWSNLALLVDQFQSRLMFGVQRELVDLIRVQFLSARQARLLYDAGYPNLTKLAAAEQGDIEELLRNSVPFQSNVLNESMVRKQCGGKNVALNGLQLLTEAEAAAVIIAEALRLVSAELAAAGLRLLSNKQLEEKITATLSSVQRRAPASQSILVTEHLESQCTQIETDEPVAEIPSNNEHAAAPVRNNSFQQPAGGSTRSKGDASPAISSIPESPNMHISDDESTGHAEAVEISSFSSTNEPQFPPLVIQEFLSPDGLVCRKTRDETNTPLLFSDLDSPASQEGTPLFPANCSPRSRREKRKLDMEETGSESRSAKTKRRETMTFDMETKIDFGDDELEVVPSSIPGSPELTRKGRSLTPEHIPSTYFEKPLEADAEDSGEFAILDVTATRSGFQTFLRNWKSQDKFAVCLGCEKYAGRSETRIGPQTRAGLGGMKKTALGLPVVSDGITVTGLAISWSKKTANYICLLNKPRSLNNLPVGLDAPLSVEERVAAVRDIFRGLSSETLVMFDAKRQIRVLSLALDVAFPQVKLRDPKVADWLLDMGVPEKSLKVITAERRPDDLILLAGMDKYHGTGSLGLAYHCVRPARLRAATEAVLARNLMLAGRRDLEERGLWELFVDVEMPLLHSLLSMELNGFGFSSSEGDNLRNSLEAHLKTIEKMAHEAAGVPFQLSAPDAVSNVLFVHLRLSPPIDAKQIRQTRGKSRTFYHTNKEVLIKLQEFHQLPILIMEHRRLLHALNNVVFPVEKELVWCPGLKMRRIYGRCCPFSVTGRVNMTEPSLQLIPKDFHVNAWEDMTSNQRWLTQHRNDKGQVVTFESRLKRKTEARLIVSLRRAFVAFNGAILLSADYSQLELRILAHLADDRKLKAALTNGGDVFKMIAAEWKKVPEGSVSDEERQQAKRICYGMIYGMGCKALAEQLGVPENDADKFVESFKSAYPDIRTFICTTVENCRRNGYVEMLGGCRRSLPDINSIKMDLRSRAERQAVNTTIQGSASHIAKTALVAIEAELRRSFPHSLPHLLRAQTKPVLELRGAFIVLQLHDEFIFEVCKRDLRRVADIVERNMRLAFSLEVPLPVNLKSGVSWGTLSPFSAIED